MDKILIISDIPWVNLAIWIYHPIYHWNYILAWVNRDNFTYVSPDLPLNLHISLSAWFIHVIFTIISDIPPGHHVKFHIVVVGVFFYTLPGKAHAWWENFKNIWTSAAHFGQGGRGSPSGVDAHEPMTVWWAWPHLCIVCVVTVFT